MYDILIQRMRDEVKAVGARELRTPQEVEESFKNQRGTCLVVVNSTCGCAAGAARPGLSLAMRHAVKPREVVAVFAGIDKEATAKAREYFDGQPPSSPSFVLMKDGKYVDMVHRHQIEGHTPEQIARRLTTLFDSHCS